jgi:serine protease Do
MRATLTGACHSMSRLTPRIALFAAALTLTACSAGPSHAQGLMGGGAPATFAPLVRRVVPAVVNITVTESQVPSETPAAMPPELRGTPFERQFRERFRNRREQVLGAGSGFIIDASGLIVTNNHVVGRADKITVALSDGTELPARLIGSDDLTDIAVIRVSSPTPLPYVTWGDSNAAQVGDWILAAGNPFGVGTSVTAGIISARGRDIGAGPFDDFIQIDAPINPGNSGGPTFNMNGEVVAVNTAIVSPTGGSVGIGFAVPAEIAQRIVADLRDKGRIDRGWLGVSVQDVQGGLGGVSRATTAGVSIAGIDRTGPAAKAGLRPGDVVVFVNGDRVDSARSLIKAIAATPPGNSVRLLVRRGAQNLDVPVVVGRRPAESAG